MIPIPQIPNYYPLINDGHTLKMAGKIDPRRMYCNRVVYSTPEIWIFPEFNNKQIIYAGYCLFQVNRTIDYSVLISLN